MMYINPKAPSIQGGTLKTISNVSVHLILTKIGEVVKNVRDTHPAFIFRQLL